MAVPVQPRILIQPLTHIAAAVPLHLPIHKAAAENVSKTGGSPRGESVPMHHQGMP